MAEDIAMRIWRRLETMKSGAAAADDFNRWKALDAAQDIVRSESKEEIGTEWGVQYGRRGARGVNQFRDRDSCERFIKYPPLWASSPHTTNPVIVSRRAASDWAPEIPKGEGKP